MSPASHPRRKSVIVKPLIFLLKGMLLVCGGLVLAQMAAAQNAASVVSVDAPAFVLPGAPFTATITLSNIGFTPWDAFTEYALGSEGPRDNTNWLASPRIPMPDDAFVVPGETFGFTTTFTAPTTPGVYNFDWAMLQERVGWFGEIASRQIKVGNGSFTPGDLVLLQIGGSPSAPTAGISANGTAIVLKNFSLSSLTSTFQVALPIFGPNALIAGSSPFTGMIDLSTDGGYIVVGGYNTNLPYTASLEAAGSPIPRAIGTVNSAGKFVLNTRTTTGFAGGTFRGAVSDGQGNFWGGAQNSGVYYFGNNFASGQITSAGLGAIRNMIMVNGKPWFSTSQFPAANNFGLVAFNQVAPTTRQEPVWVLDSGNAVTGATGTANPKGFFVSPDLTIAYVVDLRTAPNGGIYRYNGDGTGAAGTWHYAYTLTNNLFANGGAFQEVIADFSGSNPKLYATAGSGATATSGAGTNLVTAIDIGAGNTTFTLLANAPVGTAFRGLTFAPKPVSLSITRSGPDVVIRWPGGGTLRSSTGVTGPYSPVAGSPTSPYTNSPTASSRFYTVGFP